ncbi:MAG: ribosome maturation factor RimP [Betaproteobacteria bacterium]|nr:ribosome maturation factor RimP [Betaproteobacteria bacterium]
MGRGPFLFFCAVDVETITTQTVEMLGYELVDLQSSGGRRRMLRVFIDSPRGITVDDCATVSNQLTRVYAVEGVDYERLEVSSPGLDRPLKRLPDFARFTGERAQISLRLPVNGRKRFTGVLMGVDEAQETVSLQCEGVDHTFALADIGKAHLAPEI